ncbi:MAG: hypothetical protein AAFO83_00225 [Cyanobacteria bacterium J06607_13]
MPIPLALALVLILITGCASQPTPEPAPPISEEVAPEPKAEEPAELTPEAKFVLFEVIVGDLDPGGVLIVEVEQPQPETAAVILARDQWDLVDIGDRQEMLGAWHEAWTEIYGEGARLELIGDEDGESSDGDRYQIGGSKRDGEPTDLFLFE